MIIIVKSNEDNKDWPEFWKTWKKANLILNKGKSKQLNKLIDSVNYNVCHNCGAEYAVVFESNEDEGSIFTCEECKKIIKPEHYNNKTYNINIVTIDSKEKE